MAIDESATSVEIPKRPLLRGVARLFDWSGSMDRDAIQQIRKRYHEPPSSQSTEESLRATWAAVGESMRWAIGEYDKKLRQQNNK